MSLESVIMIAWEQCPLIVRIGEGLNEIVRETGCVVHVLFVELYLKVPREHPLTLHQNRALGVCKSMRFNRCPKLVHPGLLG